MPDHVGRGWSDAARCVSTLALLVVVGCPSSEPSILVLVADDSARAVIASPVDPRTVRAAPPSRSVSEAVTKSIARYYAVSDSADSLDAAFRSTRDSLNRDARALTSADRRSSAYGERFDRYLARVAAATRTREARDRARRRAATLHAQLGANAPDRTARRPGPASLHAALDSVARATGRRIHRIPLRNRRGVVEVTPGTWWLALESAQGTISNVTRHDAQAGARDTIRIGS
jgi:hypothetical protein